MENVEENIFDVLTSDVPKHLVFDRQETFHGMKDGIDRVFEGGIEDFYTTKPDMPTLPFDTVKCVKKAEQRHLVAKKDISAGSIILAAPQPICLMIDKPQIRKFCSFCVSRSDKLRQCSSCQFTHYCSQECQKKDW